MAKQKKAPSGTITDLKRKRAASPSDFPAHSSKILKALDGVDGQVVLDGGASKDPVENNSKDLKTPASLADSIANNAPLVDGKHLDPPETLSTTDDGSLVTGDDQSTSATSLSGWEASQSPDHVFKDVNG